MAARFRFVLLLAFVIGINTLHAGVRPMSLDEAITIALKQNREITIAKLGVSKASSQVTEAFGNALPSLAINAGYNYNIQLPVFFFPNPQTGQVAPLRFGLTNAYNVNAQVQQILFNSAVFTGIGASKIYEDAAEAALDAKVAEVVAETKKRYYRALAASGFVAVAEATFNNVLETRKTIEALFKEGLVAEFDKIRADVAVANTEPILIDSRAGANNALAALQTYLSLDLTDTVQLSQDGLDVPIDPPGEDIALRQAMEQNLDLKALALQVKVAKEFIAINRSDYYPTIAAFGQWQNQGQSESLSNWFSATSTVVGLNFSMNLFNGLRTSSRVEQASIDYKTAQQRYDQVLELLKLQVRASLNDVRSAKLRIDAQKTSVSQANRGYEISKIRYTEGTGSLLEITDAETALAQARVNEINALLDYHVKRADFERVTGVVDEKYRRIAR